MNKLDKKEIQSMLREQNLHFDKRMRILIQENNKILRKEMKMVFNEGIQELVIPRLDEILTVQDKHSKILKNHSETLKEHTDTLEDLTSSVYQINRKLDAEVDRDDRQDEKIKEFQILKEK